jgi:hypothetical protein
MARTLTYESIFRAGVAVGVAITDFNEQSKRENAATGANTVSVSQQAHRLAPLSGLFADDPMWAEYLQAIEQIRREDQAEDNS